MPELDELEWPEANAAKLAGAMEETKSSTPKGMSRVPRRRWVRFSEAADKKPLGSLTTAETDALDLEYLDDLVPDGSINSVSSCGWMKVAGIMDTGAAESVMPPDLCKHLPIEPSLGSVRGQEYVTANGTRLPNQGQRRIQGVTDQGLPVNLTYQVTGVTKPLNSVSRICDQGNIVTFGPDGGVIENVWTGRQTHFNRENGVYVLNTWLQIPCSPCVESPNAPDFTRRGS